MFKFDMRYSKNDLAKYDEVKHNVILWLLTDAGLTLSSPFQYVSDTDTKGQGYYVRRHTIYHEEAKIGELVRYYSNTQLIKCSPAELLTRFEIESEKHNSIMEPAEKHIIEFDVMHDRMSSNETGREIARLKELAILAKQMAILNAM